MFSWTEDRVMTLTVLWNAGVLSASQIAEQMGATRNMIIGKSGRLGLAKRPQTNQYTRKSKPKVSRPKPKYNPMSVVHFLPPTAEDKRRLTSPAWTPLPGVVPVSLMERTGCCWIVTQDSPFLYCNHSVDGGSKLSYCSHHLDMYVSKERPVRIRIRE